MNTGMRRMKLSGIGLLLVSIIGFFVYSYILFATVWDILILKFTVLIGLAAILAVLGWIGYTIATAHIPEYFNYVFKLSLNKNIRDCLIQPRSDSNDHSSKY